MKMKDCSVHVEAIIKKLNQKSEGILSKRKSNNPSAHEFGSLLSQECLKSIADIPSREIDSSIHSFRPQLSKKTLQIARNLGSSRNRVLAKKEIQPQSYPYAHTPELNKNSINIDKSFNRSESRWKSLYNLHYFAREKTDPEISVKEESECTFHPKTYSKRKPSEISIEERLKSWHTSRENKINMKKQFEAFKDMEECTFSPVIHKLKIPVFKEELARKKGVAQFLQRQLYSNSKLEVVQSTTPEPSRKEITLDQYKRAKKNLHQELMSLSFH